MKKERLLKLTFSAMFLAIGIVLPLVTAQIPVVGRMLLPMHLPVFLCGLICGWEYGTPIGAILPIMRSLIFGMPPLYPSAVGMMFELATYGFIIGFIYHRFQRKNIGVVYIALVVAMLAGRAVWAAAQAIMLGLAGSSLTFTVFFTKEFVEGLPGIVFQLLFIPCVMVALDRAGLVRFSAKD